MTKGSVALVLVNAPSAEEPTQLLKRERPIGTPVMEYPSPMFKKAPLAGIGSFFTEAAPPPNAPMPSPPAQRPRALVTL